MGYELQMIVVEKTRSTSSITQVENIVKDHLIKTVYTCYKDLEGNHHYYPDHNTKVYVPTGAIIKEGPWCRVIATMDLNKCPTFPGICNFEDSDGNSAYDPFDGNKILGLDGYGDYRKFIPIVFIIDLLQKYTNPLCNGSPDPYLIAALSLLLSLKSAFNVPRELGCMFYGH